MSLIGKKISIWSKTFSLLIPLITTGCSDTVQEGKPWEIDAKDSGHEDADMAADAKPALDCSAYTFTEVDGYYFDHHEVCGLKTCDDVCGSINLSCVERYDELFSSDVAGHVILETKWPAKRFYIYECDTQLESIYIYDEDEKLLGYGCFCE